MTKIKFILASRSPRRRRLLDALGIAFDSIDTDINEAAIRADSPRALAIKTAAMKAEAAAGIMPNLEQGSIIIAADTIVIHQGEMLGKPRDRNHAKAMLNRLSGQSHEVITGLAIQKIGGETWLDADLSRVTFHPLALELIDAYVASGQADDKAGAYGLQEVGKSFIAAVDGDISNVIGLPLAKLGKGLCEVSGEDIFDSKSSRAILLAAFPDLRDLPPELLAGIGD
jgi:septum formation protein